MDRETMQPVAWMRTLVEYENTEDGMLVFLDDAEDEHRRVPSPLTAPQTPGNQPIDPKAPRRRFQAGERDQ